MKQNKTKESGRSMVEMLGVLAVIGVLSVGGIAGYKTAMNQYMFSQISQVIRLLHQSVEESNSLENNLYHCPGNYRYNSLPHSQYFANNYLGQNFTLEEFDATTLSNGQHKGYPYQNFRFNIQGNDRYVGIWLSKVPVSVCKSLVEMVYNNYQLETKEEMGDATYHTIMWQFTEDGVEKAKAKCDENAEDGKTLFNVRFAYYPTGEYCMVPKP